VVCDCVRVGSLKNFKLRVGYSHVDMMVQLVKSSICFLEFP